VPLRLTPQRREFYDLYTQASANAVAIAERLCAMLESFPDDTPDALREIKALEHEGDRLTHDLIYLLNRTFVTPFDRDDIFRLASALDDVCDHVDEAADNIDAYKVKVIPERAKEQARVIRSAAGKLDEAVRLLEGFRDSRAHLIELRRLEDEGDRLAREAVAELFRSGQDPLSIIRWKDIHERLEEAIDACENAADVLEAIVVKNR
jgi:predicted phosphate transport protein (TIGR00153 family)